MIAGRIPSATRHLGAPADPASQLTRDLIAAGLSRPTSGPEPLKDAARAIEAAQVAVSAALAFDPGPQRDARLTDAALWIDGAKHHLTVERIRSEWVA